MNSWLYLLIAGIFEMVWVVALKFSDNFQKVEYVLLTVIAMLLSLVFLSLSFKSIPTGTAYACWTGIGAVGIIIFGVLFLGESISFSKLVFLICVIVGIVGLNITA